MVKMYYCTFQYCTLQVTKVQFWKLKGQSDNTQHTNMYKSQTIQLTKIRLHHKLATTVTVITLRLHYLLETYQIIMNLMELVKPRFKMYTKYVFAFKLIAHRSEYIGATKLLRRAQPTVKVKHICTHSTLSKKCELKSEHQHNHNMYMFYFALLQGNTCQSCCCFLAIL